MVDLSIDSRLSGPNFNFCYFSSIAFFYNALLHCI